MTKERLRRIAVTQESGDMRHVAILIDRTPEVMETAIDLEEYFVEVPSIAGAQSVDYAARTV